MKYRVAVIFDVVIEADNTTLAEEIASEIPVPDGYVEESFDVVKCVEYNAEEMLGTVPPNSTYKGEN